MSDNAEISGAPAGPLLLQIADRVLNRPLLIHPSKAEVILHVLEGRLPLGGGALAPLPPDANRFIGTHGREDGSFRMNRAHQGVAIIPVTGSLVNRGAWIGAQSGLTSYEGLSAQLREAADDPNVSSILLDIDSPGGEATGMFSLAEQVRQIGQTKPVTAFVNDMAASAAYGIASAANEIVVSPTSIVGSIGVVMTHMDRSKQMEITGVKPTLIYAGAHKVDGNPFGPLSETVQADLQGEVMKFYDQFVGLVARGRPGTTASAIRATEARTYIGQDAVDRGLADRIATLDEVLTDLSAAARPKRVAAAKPRRAAPAAGRGQKPEKGPADALRSVLALPEARGRYRQAVALALDANATPDGAAEILRHLPLDADGGGIDLPSRQGQDPKLDRIRAILLSPEAAAREEAAIVFAFSTNLPVDQVRSTLGRLEQNAEKPKTPTIAERAAMEAEFGGSYEPGRRGSSEIWKAAVGKANAEMFADRGAAPSAAAAPAPTNELK